MNYYKWWHDNKPKFALLPALLFWLVSGLFFIIGLSFENPMVLYGVDFSTPIAIALALSITIIQVIGNDQDENTGFIMKIGWYASYVLGIGTNVNGLLMVFNIPNEILEWSIALSLGTMIEVLPERLLVTFLKSTKSTVKVLSGPTPLPQKSMYKPQHKPVHAPAYHTVQKPVRPDHKAGIGPIIKTGRDLLNEKDDKLPWERIG